MHRDEPGVSFHWTATYNIRKKDLDNKEHKVADIFNKYPILKDTASYELVSRIILKKYNNGYFFSYLNFFFL